MGLFDKVKGAAEKAVDKHGEKISSGLDKAAATVDAKTGGKHSAKIAGGVGKAKAGLDRLDGKRDEDLGPSGPPGPPRQ